MSCSAHDRVHGAFDHADNDGFGIGTAERDDGARHLRRQPPDIGLVEGGRGPGNREVNDSTSRSARLAEGRHDPPLRHGVDRGERHSPDPSQAWPDAVPRVPTSDGDEPPEGVGELNRQGGCPRAVRQWDGSMGRPTVRRGIDRLQKVGELVEVCRCGRSACGPHNQTTGIPRGVKLRLARRLGLAGRLAVSRASSLSSCVRIAVNAAAPILVLSD